LIHFQFDFDSLISIESRQPAEFSGPNKGLRTWPAVLTLRMPNERTKPLLEGYFVSEGSKLGITIKSLCCLSLNRKPTVASELRGFDISILPRFLSCALGLSLLLLSATGSLAQKAAIENGVKAAHLFRFAQFVQWPSSAFTNAQSPIIIGILGQDYLGSKIDEAAAGQSINGRPVTVKRCRSVDEAEQCHILFISRSESNKVDRILAVLDGKSVLTVSDLERFSSQGGMIRLIGEGGRVRFRINSNVTDRAGLVISSKLLRLAERVNRGKS
jgi:hypothetical protein